MSKKVPATGHSSAFIVSVCIVIVVRSCALFGNDFKLDFQSHFTYKLYSENKTVKSSIDLCYCSFRKNWYFVQVMEEYGVVEV